MDDVARKKISYDWTKENGRFIPMPATYLNQRRWEDQATTISGSPVIAKVARYDRTRNTAVLTAWMKRMSAEGYDDGDITRACNEIYNTAEEDLTVEEIDRMSHSCAHPRKKWKGIANSNLTFP